MERKLYRSESDRVLLGVCGGLAKYFEVDAVLIRIIAVLTLFIGGGGVLAYIILAIIIPTESSKSTKTEDTLKENVEDLKSTATMMGQEIQSAFSSKDKPSNTETTTRRKRHNLLGIIIIIIGIILVFANFNLFWWFEWRYIWPFIIIAIGAVVIISARRRK